MQFTIKEKSFCEIAAELNQRGAAIVLGKQFTFTIYRQISYTWHEA
jgi:hypothetical protein